MMSIKKFFSKNHLSRCKIWFIRLRKKQYRKRQSRRREGVRGRESLEREGERREGGEKGEFKGGGEVEGLRGQAWMAYHASLLTQSQVVQEKKMFFHGFPNVINTLPHCLIVDFKSEEKKNVKTICTVHCHWL